jgi:integrase
MVVSGRDEYVPVLGDREWSQVRDFVLPVVEEALPHTPYSRRELLFAVSRLAVWARTPIGPALPRDAVLARITIDRFAQQGLPEFAPASRANVRAQLLRVAEALLDPRRAGTRLRPLGAADPTAPYERADVVALLSWTRTQNTARRRADAAVLLALGLGAGLSASEIGTTRACDIRMDADGVTVVVHGDRARTVPVLGRWERTLARALDLSPDAYVFRPNREGFWPNLISNFVGRAPGAVRPQTQRMRSTWIVHHLEQRAPLAALMDAAGVDSLEAFTRYMQFVTPPDTAAARSILRGMLDAPIELSLDAGGQDEPPPRPGRPMDAATSWGLLWELSGHRADWLPARTLARVRMRLRGWTSETIASAVAGRGPDPASIGQACVAAEAADRANSDDPSERECGLHALDELRAEWLDAH